MARYRYRVMSKQARLQRLQRRSDAKTRSLIKATLIPFCGATFLFLFAVVALTALSPTTQQPKDEVSRSILTILH